MIDLLDVLGDAVKEEEVKSVTVCSAALSVCCSSLGILISILAGTPVGSTIVAVDIAAFVIFFAIGKISGGIRK